MGNINECALDEMSYEARLGDSVLQKSMFHEMEVVHGVAVNEVLKPS